MRSEALNQLLAEVLNSSNITDENRQEPAPARAVRRSGSDVGPRIAGVYVISVAARLADMHPQTLRKYDREGLVSPSRTDGQRRLYSEEDVARLKVIRTLAENKGLNLAGVNLVLELVPHIRGIVELLEASREVAGSRTAKVAAAELRRILAYVGAE